MPKSHLLALCVPHFFFQLSHLDADIQQLDRNCPHGLGARVLAMGHLLAPSAAATARSQTTATRARVRSSGYGDPTVQRRHLARPRRSAVPPRASESSLRHLVLGGAHRVSIQKSFAMFPLLTMPRSAQVLRRPHQPLRRHHLLRHSNLHSPSLPAHKRLSEHLTLLRRQRVAFLPLARGPDPPRDATALLPRWPLLLLGISATGSSHPEPQSIGCAWDDSRDDARGVFAPLAQGVAVHPPALADHAPLRRLFPRPPGNNLPQNSSSFLRLAAITTRPDSSHPTFTRPRGGIFAPPRLVPNRIPRPRPKHRHVALTDRTRTGYNDAHRTDEHTRVFDAVSLDGVASFLAPTRNGGGGTLRQRKRHECSRQSADKVVDAYVRTSDPVRLRSFASVSVLFRGGTCF